MAVEKEQGNGKSTPVFKVERIYTQAQSFEAKETVKLKEWKPETPFELQIQTAKSETNRYEVSVILKVTSKSEGTELFKSNVVQAGLFTLEGYNEAQVEHILNTLCPTMLYPYACERLSNMILQAGFPPLQLTPLNFDALYQQKKIQEQQHAQGKAPQEQPIDDSKGERRLN